MTGILRLWQGMREALAAIQRIDGACCPPPTASGSGGKTIFPQGAGLACRNRPMIMVWEVKFRSGADLRPGDRFRPSFVVNNADLSLYAAVSDRPDFGWRKWFENMIQTQNAASNGPI